MDTGLMRSWSWPDNLALVRPSITGTVELTPDSCGKKLLDTMRQPKHWHIAATKTVKTNSAEAFFLKDSD